MTELDSLINLIKKLPGMGEKSATRLAYRLIKTDPSYNKALGEAISSIQDKLHPCPICGSYTESEICEFCSSDRRDKSILCIVQEPQEVVSINSAGVYQGLFHVLGGAINPLNGITPDKLNFKTLKRRLDEGQFKEVIIATNPTEEGDTTALYISHMLREKEDLKITRLASGLPIGGELGYVDKLTLVRSLKGRVKL